MTLIITPVLGTSSMTLIGCCLLISRTCGALLTDSLLSFPLLPLLPKAVPPITASPPAIHGRSAPELLPLAIGKRTSKPEISLNNGAPLFQSNHKKAQSLSSKTKSETILSSYCTKKFWMVMTSPFCSFKIKLLPS